MLHLSHIRRRHLKKKGSYSNSYHFLDALFYVVAILAPFMTLPQLYVIWVKRTVEGVSVASFMGYIIFNFFWVIYGLIHKDKPILLCNTIWIVLEGLVVLGVLLYR